MCTSIDDKWENFTKELIYEKGINENFESEKNLSELIQWKG